MTTFTKVQLDLNTPGFQQMWFALEKEDAEALRKALAQLTKMSWLQVYQSKGLKWEKISIKEEIDGKQLYSIRITQKFRAVVTRDGDFMRFLTLHPDHDSAYH